MNTVEDMKHAHRDLKITMMDIAKSLGDLTTLLLGDAYTYQAIVED